MGLYVCMLCSLVFSIRCVRQSLLAFSNSFDPFVIGKALFSCGENIAGQGIIRYIPFIFQCRKYL